MNVGYNSHEVDISGHQLIIELFYYLGKQKIAGFASFEAEVYQVLF